MIEPIIVAANAYFSANPYTWLGLTTTDWITLGSGLGGAIIGAVIGGCISWLLSWQSGRALLVRDKAERRDREKAAAIKTLLKTAQITNGIYSIVGYIDDSVEKAKTEDLKFKEIWEIIRPSANSNSTNIVFDIDNFIQLLNKDGSNLINRCILLAGRYVALEESLVEWSRQRISYSDFTDPLVDDQTGRASLTVEQKRVIERKAQGLNHLMTHN